MATIALVTLDTFSAKMAGPAIRVWEMATLLSASHDVRVLSFGQADRTPSSFSLNKTRVATFEEDLGCPDIVIVQGYLLATFPWLGQRDWKLVVDLYDPFHIESLGVEKHRPLTDRTYSLNHALNELKLQLTSGDFFLCASTVQRDMWIGHLAALGRINPTTYDADPSLHRLITTAPFGVTSNFPDVSRHRIKGVVPGINPGDTVLIWAGGIYNWFDPLTVIRAVHLLRTRRPELRLFFLGGAHPNPDVPAMEMAARARELSDDLGLTGTHVFFNEEWVDYGLRHEYLADADIGVTAHFSDIETHFSFRTRVLDYLWSGLPILTSEGDFFARLVEDRGIGAAVEVESPEAMAEAIDSLIDRVSPDLLGRVRDVGAEFTWERSLAELLEYCNAPYFADDRIDRSIGESGDVPRPGRTDLLRRAISYARHHGLKAGVSKAVRYLRR